MKLASLLVLVYAMSLSTSQSLAKEFYDFIVNRIACVDTDPRITVNVTCYTRALSRNLKRINILIYLVPNVTIDDIWIVQPETHKRNSQVRISYFQRLNNAYKRSIANVEENFCGFTAGTAKSNLIKILWPYLKKSSDIVGCPIKSSHNISDMEFGDKFLPAMLPEGQARLDVHIRNGPARISLVKVQVFLEVKPKGAIKLDF